MVCMIGVTGRSKNLPTLSQALLWVRPMNFWPTRATFSSLDMLYASEGF